MDKKALSERDICTKYITPAIAKGGRGTAKFADYVLYAKPNANIPLAIVEAKDSKHGVGDGMQQGLVEAVVQEIVA